MGKEKENNEIIQFFKYKTIKTICMYQEKQYGVQLNQIR